MTLGNIRGMSQTELRDLIADKASEIQGLIEQIDENTQFEAFGTCIYGVLDKEEEEGAVAGFTLYGRTIDIAQIIRRKELTHLQMAVIMLISETEKEDDE